MDAENPSMSSPCPFAQLGLPITWDVPVETLEQAYFSQQRILHPDRFVGKSEAERLKAQDASAALNTAYQTLKSPLSRAKYLLEHRGLTLEGPQDPSVLMDMMDLSEEVDAAQGSAINTLKDIVQQDMEISFTDLGRHYNAQNWPACIPLFQRLCYLDRLRTTLHNKKDI